MDISNKTKRPLSIKLPGGKVLRLGPGNTGQITPKAAATPAVQKLIDEGVIEIVGDGGKHGATGAQSDSSSGSSQVRSSGGSMRRSGDR